MLVLNHGTDLRLEQKIEDLTNGSENSKSIKSSLGS